MEIEQTSLYNEIKTITRSKLNSVFFNYTAQIHANDITEQILKVLSINVFRNYEKNIGDEVILEAMIPLGLYSKIIYPNRNILEITLTRNPLSEVTNVVLVNNKVETERYKAVLILNGLVSTEGTEKGKMSRESLDLQNIVNIKFQLFNKSLETLRLITIGGIFRKINAESVIRAVLTNESLRIKINGKNAIDSVDIIKTNNEEIKEHIVIPQGTKLISIPTFIQEKCGGVYSSGIGTYLQHKTWYVYPLYDTTKLNKALRTLTIIKVPMHRYSGIERTYREEDGSVFILATSESIFTDDASTAFMDDGNGVRLADANKFMGNEAIVGNNKAFMNRGTLNSEYIIKQKDDNFNNVQLSKTDITSNPYNDYSALTSKDGGLFQLLWENSNPGLLFPGMKVKILYLDDRDIIELHGVLLATQGYTQLAGVGLTINRHITTTQLSVIVNKANTVIK